MRLDPPEQGPEIEGTRLSRDLASALEQDQRRDAANAEARGYSGLRLGIEAAAGFLTNLSFFLVSSAVLVASGLVA